MAPPWSYESLRSHPRAVSWLVGVAPPKCHRSFRIMRCPRRTRARLKIPCSIAHASTAMPVQHTVRRVPSPVHTSDGIHRWHHWSRWQKKCNLYNEVKFISILGWRPLRFLLLLGWRPSVPLECHRHSSAPSVNGQLPTVLTPTSDATPGPGDRARGTVGGAGHPCSIEFAQLV